MNPPHFPRSTVGHPIVSRDGDGRHLHRLVLPEEWTGIEADSEGYIAAVVDVGTTGLDADRDSVIELAIRQVAFDDDGRITRIGRSRTWLADPGAPLASDIVKLTGLTDDMLRGRVVDRVEAAGLIVKATIVVAHNAGFVRPHVERLLPAAADARWACSMAEVDWRGHGLDGSSLGHLLTQIGYFSGAHRAADDVDALIALLAHGLPGGRTVLAELLGRSFREGLIVRASGAPYDRRNVLKVRGYNWDGRRRVWWREVPEDARGPEEAWLLANVYDIAEAAPMKLSWERVDNRTRWS